VLNLTTGYVSPQFHIVFDPSFSTVSGNDGNQAPPSMWQTRCGFTNNPKSRYAHAHKNEESPFVINPGMAPDGGKDSGYEGSLMTDSDDVEPTLQSQNINSSRDTTTDKDTTPPQIQQPPPPSSTPSTYFDVDTTLERQSRKGRGTRGTKFHEEYGYEALVSESVVNGEILALATVVQEPT
jgi:hypothetical protein